MITNDAGANQEYETDLDNRLETDGTYRYEYDAEGNRILRYVDDNTNEIFDSGDDDITEYAWDHRNRLVTVTNYDTYGGDSTQQVDYTYDAQNQLIKRVVDTDGETGTDAIEQTFYLWENGQIALQFDKTDTGDADYEDLSHRYLWGPEVDQLLVDEVINDVMDSDESERRWALPDHLGTIRDWIDDAAGLLDHAEYDSAGRRLDTPAIDAAFGFHGLLHDKSTGNNYNRNRWSDPDTGGFLSEDPIKDGTNWRAAYGNAAVMFVDPTGLYDEEHTSGARPSTEDKHEVGQARQDRERAKAAERQAEQTSGRRSQAELQKKIADARQDIRNDIKKLEKQRLTCKNESLSEINKKIELGNQAIRELNDLKVQKGGNITEGRLKLGEYAKAKLRLRGIGLSLVNVAGIATMVIDEIKGNAPVDGRDNVRIVDGTYYWDDDDGRFQINKYLGWTGYYYKKQYVTGCYLGHEFEISYEDAKQLKEDYIKRNGTFKFNWWNGQWEWQPGTEQPNPPGVHRQWGGREVIVY